MLRRRLLLLGIVLLASFINVTRAQDKQVIHLVVITPHEPIKTETQNLISQLQANLATYNIAISQDIFYSEKWLSDAELSAWDLSIYQELEFDTVVRVYIHPVVKFRSNVSPLLETALANYPDAAGIYLTPTDVDDRKLAENLSTALALYTLNHCDLAMPYLNQAESDVQNILSPQATIEPDDDLYWLNMMQISRVESMELYRGICAIESGDYDKAIHHLSGGLNRHRPYMLDPAFSINLAWVYLQLDDQKQAFASETWPVLTNRDVDIKPAMKVIALSKRAQLYALVERYNDAIADLSTAIELDKNNLDLYLLRGKMYLAQYEWDSALADYNTAIELDPTYADAYYERGVLYYSILQTGVELRTEAFDDFHRYLELAPDGDHAADALRYITQIEKELEALNG